MTEERSRYRRELKGWSKNELIREVERLRAITREHAERPGEDTTNLQGTMVDPIGDPNARGNVVIDARNAILMETVECCLVDADPREELKPERLCLTLGGRVNMRNERSQVLFMFDVDGAAAIVSQLVALGGRIGPAFQRRLMERAQELSAQG
jgi:hypothetical protein